MRINIISNFGKNTGLNQDTFILRGILTGIFDKDVSIACVPHVYPHCEEADANIFIETINPSLFPYARKNIWIPNIEWTRRTWEPYMGMVDEIWVKTREAEDVFTSLTKTTIRNIGWTSIDKGWDVTMKKNYHKAFVPVGKNLYRYPRPILQAYARIKENNPTLYDKLPTLFVVYSPEHMQVTVPETIQDKVVIKAEVMKDTEYDELLKECGICICTSLTEGFCHAVNEAMSVGCNLILSPIRPFVDDLVGEVQIGVEYCEKLNSQEQTDCIGTLVDVSVQSICDALERYANTSFKEKRNASEVIRGVYESRHKNWVTSMKELLPTVFDTSLPEYRLKDVFPKEDELPDVSIITLTKDRRKFMALATYCYLLQTYPEDKMEWVIVDDGEDSIEDTLIGVPNVTYVRCEPGMTIGQKRNLGVSRALYDTIVICDDDDVYPENTVLHRVAMMMKEPVKECGFCTTIPCYDITKYSSFMNVPPMTLPMSQRVSEATLVFTRRFWEDRKFDDSSNIAEGDAFIRGREQMCRELSPQEVIVSLTHPNNLSSRKIPDFKEPNGCHYGFNEKLFALVSEIGVAMEQPNTSVRTESGETCETSSSCETSGDAHP